MNSVKYKNRKSLLSIFLFTFLCIGEIVIALSSAGCKNGTLPQPAVATVLPVYTPTPKSLSIEFSNTSGDTNNVLAKSDNVKVTVNLVDQYDQPYSGVDGTLQINTTDNYAQVVSATPAATADGYTLQMNNSTAQLTVRFNSVNGTNAKETLSAALGTLNYGSFSGSHTYNVWFQATSQVRPYQVDFVDNGVNFSYCPSDLDYGYAILNPQQSCLSIPINPTQVDFCGLPEYSPTIPCDTQIDRMSYLFNLTSSFSTSPYEEYEFESYVAGGNSNPYWNGMGTATSDKGFEISDLAYSNEFFIPLTDPCGSTVLLNWKFH